MLLQALPLFLAGLGASRAAECPAGNGVDYSLCANDGCEGGRDGEDNAPDTIYCRACARGYKPAETEPLGEPGAEEGAEPDPEAHVRVLSCKKDGLGPGAIAGIVIAVVVVVGLVVFLCVYFLVCRKRKQSSTAV